MPAPLPKHVTDLIREHYPSGDLDWLSKKLGKSKGTISEWCRKNGIKRVPRVTEKHKKLIFEHYEKGDLEWLSLETGKSVHAIQEWARKKGLKRKINVNRKGDLSRLLSGSMESYYWLGYYLADGYISKNGHFMLSQCEKDKDQVYKLADFLSTSVYVIPKEKRKNSYAATDCYRVSVCDKIVGKKIRNMFKIISNKTEDGVYLGFLKQDDPKNISMLMGFLDGDAYVCSQNHYCSVECYKSWLECLTVLKYKLPKEYRGFDIKVRYKESHKDKYCYFRIGAKITRLLKKFALEHNLPVSDRKWSKIPI